MDLESVCNSLLPSCFPPLLPEPDGAGARGTGRPSRGRGQAGRGCCQQRKDYSTVRYGYDAGTQQIQKIIKKTAEARAHLSTVLCDACVVKTYYMLNKK